MADIDDLLNAAADQQPTKFAAAFDEIMGQKIADSVEDIQVSIAQGMFASDDEEELDDAEFEDEDEDYYDESDEDEDDYEWDEDDDFDLDEDEDLEGFDDDEDA